MAAVPATGEKTTITFLSNVNQSGNYLITVALGKNVVLDLNGFTYKQEVTSSAASELILNEGTLTITDNSENHNGMLANIQH